MTGGNKGGSSSNNGKTYKYVDQGGDFEIGESVLVEYKNLYYPAKVRKLGIEDQEMYYFIHYVGWNKSRDEWVWKDRILKQTPENEAMAEGLQAQAREAAKLARKKSHSGKEGKTSIQNSQEVLEEGPSTSKSSIANNVSKDESSSEVDLSFSEVETVTQEKKDDKTEEDSKTGEESREHFISFPDQLSEFLVDECLKNTENKLDLDLPAKFTVNNILDDYIRHVAISGGCELNAAGVALAIKHDFNALIRSKLLYPRELVQFQKLESTFPATEPSDLFGANHLLRLFTIIGRRLKDEFQPEEFESIIKDLEGFLMFLHCNYKKYFAADSSSPPGSPLVA